MTEDTFTVRGMAESDVRAAAGLAAKLVQMHHDFDPKRFMHLPNAAPGYAGFLAGELESKRVVLVVAERDRDKAIVGYAYGRLEGRDWNELLDAHGKLHDVYVDERARGAGLGERLVMEIVRVLTERGAPRVVLSTATQNASAQRLFTKLGFRTTMLEMTREKD